MPAKNHSTGLPQIPSLPPIQMPEATQSPSTSMPPPQRAKTPLPPSVPPLFASQDPFQAARISASPRDPNGTHADDDLLLPPSPHALSPSSNLRKSLSADSFVRSAPPPAPAPPQPTRSTRVHTMSSSTAPPQELRQRVSNLPVPDDATFDPSRLSLRGRDKRSMPPPPVVSRSQGLSAGTQIDVLDGVSFFDESDSERPEQPSRRSWKGKAASRQIPPPPPPGELLMPSRLHPMSSPSSASSNVPAPIVPVRGSSLSHKLAKSKTHVSLDTHTHPQPQFQHITIAVIGSAGCGKSTVIRKGLKAHSLSEPTVTTVSASSGTGSELTLTYATRTASSTIAVDSASYECLLRVLEIDCSGFGTSVSGLPFWEGLSLDGVVMCYDAGQEESFIHVIDRLEDLSQMKLPTVVLACKSDLEKDVDPAHASKVLEQQYDVGVVEVTALDHEGKAKIRSAFELIFNAICPQQPWMARSDRDGYRNPASPAVVGSAPPWDISRASSATPTAGSAAASQSTSHRTSSTNGSLYKQYTTPTPPPSQPPSQAGTPIPTQAFHLPSPSSATSSRTPTTPTSPTRARSTSDLLSEHEKSRRDEREQHSGGRNVGLVSPSVRSRGSLNALSGMNGSAEGTVAADETHETTREPSIRESRAPPWMTLEELLNKLLFMAVSDDDPLFISHFLLTYRRFATPRSILLAMQKRMRALDQPSGDPMFACYAQMRICLLLDKWIRAYPTDFAVPGAAGALSALIKSILTKTYLLHYGAEFLPFLDNVPVLRDRDRAWALQVYEESDDSSVLSDEEGYSTLETRSSLSSKTSHSPLPRDRSLSTPHNHTMSTRDRKSSLPLTSKARDFSSSILSPAGLGDPGEVVPKQTLKKLVGLSEEVQKVSHKDIAMEITRMEARHFLLIQPRHWLQHVFVQGRKDPETDPIAKYNHISNHIADWVVSLILCHDKAKARTRQIEKFVQVAEDLRVVHNYSALRAVIAGINSATFDGDMSLELMKTRSQELWKKFQSYDQLLQSVRSHQKYRMALRNTKGACIPALEIHLSDLIRAHEGNTDYHDDDPTKIHWAKFNMMAKFIDVVVQCQDGCRISKDTAYHCPEQYKPPDYLLFDKGELLMNFEMQRSRIAPPDQLEDGYVPGLSQMNPQDPQHQPRDAALLRRILFW